MGDSITATVTSRGDSHTYTCSDAVLAAALLAVAPIPLLIARLAGLVVILTVKHGQPFVRTAFNVAQTAASTALAAYIVARIAGQPGRLDGRLVVGILLALCGNSALSAIAIVTAKSLASDCSQFGQLPKLIGYGVASSLAQGSFALVGAIAGTVSPFAILLIVGPAALAVLAYRRAVTEQVQRTNIEFLYEITNTLHRATDVDAGLASLLDKTAVMFRSRIALVGMSNGDHWWWTGVGPHPAQGPGWLPEAGSCIVERHNSGAENRLLQQIDEPTALVGRFSFGGGSDGIVVVAGKQDGHSGYKRSDLHVFELLTDQVRFGLENEELERSLGEVTRLEQQMRFQATHDPLTGLANRAVLQARLADQSAGPVLLVDLDDFKAINDSLGHQAGDEVLKTVAGRLVSASRQNDVVARLGGDEFAILLGEGTSAPEATGVATRIEAQLKLPIDIGLTSLVIGASVGVAMPEEGQSLDDLVRAADVALYRSKELGKGRATVFEPGMDREAREHLVLIGALRESLSREHVIAHYQPIFEISTNRIVGVEALARWDHPTRGLLLPGQFLGHAERAGLAGTISNAVFAQACSALASWSDVPGRPFVSLNVAASQLADHRIVADLKALVARHGIDASQLSLEITESAAIQDFDRGLAVLNRIRDLGCRISLDDFGTGYSSLSMLHRLPIDAVKLDRSFVEGFGPAASARSLLGAAIDIAGALGLEVIAEGVERAGQLSILRSLGCRYAQGFLLGSPQDELRTGLLLRGEATDLRYPADLTTRSALPSLAR